MKDTNIIPNSAEFDPNFPIEEDIEKRILDLEDILNAPPQKTIWAYIVEGVNNALVASSEAGKSTLAMQLALAIAGEKETFLGWEIKAQHHRVLIISTEDGQAQLRNRFETMIGSQPKPPKDRIRFILDTGNIMQVIEEALNDAPVDLVIIDTWGDLVGGDYEAKLTRQRMREIRKVCSAFGATPLYIHHTNKVSENIPDKSSIKGAGDFEQACRCVMMLCIYNDSRWLCCVKGNPFPEDYKDTCHELAFNPNKQEIIRTGKTKSRKEIIQALKYSASSTGRPAVAIDWEEVTEGKPTRRSELIEKLDSQYGLKKTQAGERIKEAVYNHELFKNENGLYSTK